MTDNYDHFEEFAYHTQLKHFVLRAYLHSWARKLLSARSSRRFVNFIDGFGGCGQDKLGQPGSPLIAMTVAATIANGETPHLTPGARLRVFVCETEKRYFSMLEQCTAQMRDALRPDCRLVRGSLSDNIDLIVNACGDGPILTFLDPFGIKGLQIRDYPRLLAGQRNEIFALFAYIGAVRLQGVVTADNRAFLDKVAAAEESLNLWDEQQSEDIKAIQAQAERQAAHLKATQLPSREYLLDAIGERGLQFVQGTPLAEQPRAFVKAFTDALLTAGATHVVLLPICDASGHPKYMLVHASKSPHAVVTMKEAMSSAVNRKELPEVMRRLISEDLRVSVRRVADQLHVRFAGRVLPWSNEETGNTTVRFIALSTTGHFPLHNKELVREFRSRQWYRRDSTLGVDVVDFPARPT